MLLCVFEAPKLVSTKNPFSLITTTAVKVKPLVISTKHFPNPQIKISEPQLCNNLGEFGRGGSSGWPARSQFLAS